jgi:carnitine O-acetyltransferase
MLELQRRTLPRLPVPPLHQTIEKYLFYVRAMLTPEQFAKTKLIAEDFAKSDEGKRLHNYVTAMANNPRIPNWLDRWWSDAYLKDRSSPGIFVSPLVCLSMHPNAAVNLHSCARAALFLKYTVEYKRLIDNQMLPICEIRGEPTCMRDFSYLLNSVRIPQVGRDTLASYPESTHVVVLRKGRVFKLEVMDPATNMPKSIQELVGALRWIKMAAATPPSDGVSLGAATALHRDDWARGRGLWINSGPANSKVLLDIESAILVLTLDDCRPEPDSTAAMWGGFYGFEEAGERPYVNRYYDKSLQLHVADNGACSLTFEHSGQDSLPPIFWAQDCMRRQVEDERAVAEAVAAASASSLPSGLHEVVKELRLVDIDSELRSVFIGGVGALNRTMAQLDLCALKISFGAETIKQFKVSPDAFAQMMYQVAFMQMFGYTPSTYESATTKTFLLGRTETLRTVTSASVDFVRAFLEDRPVHEVGEKLRTACRIHSESAKACSQGQGCDRHLYGMLCAARETGMPLPAIFTDPSYAFFSTIEVSTSHPLATFGSRFVGFGPVSPKCVGIGYYVLPKEMLFGISTWQHGTACRFSELMQAAAAKMLRCLDGSSIGRSSNL